MTTETTTTEAVKAKGPVPALKGISHGEGGWKEDIVLWDHEGGKRDFSGYTNVEGHASVVGFINTNGAKETQFISLSKRVTDAATGETSLVKFATGNALLARNDGKPVYQDTVIFNTVSGKTFNARVAPGASEALRAAMGFTGPAIPRPVVEKAAAAEAVTEGGDAEEAVAVDRPRAS